MQKGINDWIVTEICCASFGDERLNKRYQKILKTLSNFPNKSIPQAFKSWSETIAAYRFFNNENITSSKILESHQKETLNRIRKEKIVLIPQDTTEINFTGRNSIKDMGYLGTTSSQGFFLHLSLAITPEKLCLGITDSQTTVREKLGTRKDKGRPIEEKESYRWLKGYQSANAVALACPDTIIVSISDREGDIHDILEKEPSEENKAFWLIRSKSNRIIFNQQGKKEPLKLWEYIHNTQPIGEIEFQLEPGKIYNRTIYKKRSPRIERIVRQEIRSCTVYLQSKHKGSIVPINIIHCKEINAPSDEEGIEWFLLTSFPINDASTAIKAVQWYLCRWQIEVFFKILKSGCTVEELQFDTLKATTNCIAIYLIVAWRILYLTMLGRHCPDIPCSSVFEENEWHSVYAIVTKKSPPKETPKLNEIILMIAKLGGFLGRKSDGYPGPKVMWIGMQRMKDFSLAWETFRGMDGATYV